MSMLSSLPSILVHETKNNSIHHLFRDLGFQIIEYFELILLVESPFIAKSNQHDSSNIRIGLSSLNPISNKI
jgi:hypothetical protein